MKFPDAPWESTDLEDKFNFQQIQKELQTIDEWLKEEGFNQYGDPIETLYAGTSPLFDEITQEIHDRMNYLKKKFPDSPWDEMAIIDSWLEKEGLNEFGDPIDTVYMGGSPLFDMTTGAMMDRKEYLKKKFPDSPWD